MDKDIKNSVELFAQAFIGFFIQFGLGVFLARQLSESLYGDYNVAMRFLAILVVFALYGTDVGANRFLAKYLKKHQMQASGKYIAWNVKLLSVTFLISIVVAIMAFVVMWVLHYFDVQHINHYHLAVYSLWLVPFYSISVIINSFLVSSQHAQVSTFYSKILRYVIMFSLFVVIALYIDPMLHNISIILILFISSIILSFVSSLSMNRDLSAMFYRGIKQLKVTHLDEQGWMTTSSHLIVNNVFYTIICALDLLVVEVCASTEAETGYYAAALTITAVLALVPASIYQSLKPELAVLLKTEAKKNLLQKRLNKVNLIALILLALLAFALIVFKTELLSFFGPNYATAGTAVIILTIGSSISYYTQMSVVLMIIAGHEKLVLHGTVSELVGLFIFLVPATYYYGIVGTASVTSLAMITKGLSFTVIANKKLGIKASNIR
jgi:O-antigen/teichoic acid export membrane protein